MPTEQDILDRLRTVKDPELHRDLVTLNMIKHLSIDGSRVKLVVELTTPACPMKDRIRQDIERALTGLKGIQSVDIQWGAQVRSSLPAGAAQPQIKNIVAVGAGKGGVGKSTAAVLLAVGLRRAGASVGLLDADVYGPSIPTMMGIEGSRPTIARDMIVPLEACGVKLISIGFMLDPDKPVIWRGPMVHGAVKQFIEQVDWGDLDYLIVDLPPGTGDVPLTLAQTIPMTGAVVVCTPQDVALSDARRAVKMYEQLNVPCIGMIENMSYYLCPKCGHRDELFDHGGAAAAARKLGVPFLGEIPLNADLRKYGDRGTPEKMFTSTKDYVRKAIDSVVSNLAGQVSIRAQRVSLTPSFSVE